MGNFIKKCVFILSLFAIATASAANANNLNKEAIEAATAEKTRTALHKVLAAQEYLLNVEVRTKVVEPEIVEPPKRVKPNDSSDSSRENYLLFRKLGLEVLREEAPSPANAPVALPEEKLESVRVNVYLDESLPLEIKESAKDIMSKLSYNMEVVPEVSISDIKLAKKPVLQPTPMDILERFATSIGFVAATLILTGAMFVLFFMYSRLSKNTTTAMISAQKEVAAATSEASAAAPAAASAGGSEGSTAGAGGPDGSGLNGDLNVNLKNEGDTGSDIPATMARFRSFYEKKEKDAVAMLKKWIKLKPAGSAEALLVLAQELDSETLGNLFASLSAEDRKEWKRALSFSGRPDSAKGAMFINEQILEETIVPTDLVGEETKTLLYSLEPEDCARLIAENPEVGPLLMNTLAPSFIAKMLPLLDGELVGRLTLESALAAPEQLKQKDESLKENLKKYAKTDASSPFSDKIMELLPHVSADNEDFFYKAYGQTATRSNMKAMLGAFLPAKLIPELPDNVLKEILNRIPQDLLLQALVVFDEEKKDKFLAIAAPEGSKKRELLDLELGNLTKNEVGLARLKQKQKTIEADFTALTRRLIQQIPGLADQIDLTLEQACDRYMTAEKGAQHANAA